MDVPNVRTTPHLRHYKSPEAVSYIKLIQACRDNRDLHKGREIHTQIAQSKHRRDRILLNLLVEMYSKCGSLIEAQQMFESIEQRNVYSWNIMITAYAHNGHLQEAQKLFDRMPERDSVSWNSIITAYAQEGHLNQAWWLFQKMPVRNRISWNTMITANAQYGYSQRALVLFRFMDLEGIQPDEYTFSGVIDACSSNLSVSDGILVHKFVVETGYISSVVVGSSLVNMYGKFGQVQESEAVFHQMQERSMILCTTMLSAYAQNGHSVRAIDLFRNMDLEGVTPDKVTFVEAFNACGLNSSLTEGRSIHNSMKDGKQHLEKDVVIGTSLIDMYGKCKSAGDSRDVFDMMCNKNVFTWTAMIAAYSQNGCGRDGINLFQKMVLEGERPNYVTFVSVLDACSAIPLISFGRVIHKEIVDMWKEEHTACSYEWLVLTTAIVSMYAKCGSMEEAYAIFHKMHFRNEVSWNAMVAGYTQSGEGQRAVEISRLMELEGVAKNDITFSMILAACSRCGLVDQGVESFVMMREDYGIEPTSELYSSMIDVFARGGKLAEAEELVKNMPSALAWSTLLGSCKDTNMAQAATAARKASELDGYEDAGPHLLLLSKAYAGAL